MTDTTLAEARAGVAEAFTDLASLLRSLTYVVTGTPTRNPTTGDVTEVTTSLALQAFVTTYRAREIDGERVRVGDLQVIVERAKADAAAVAAGVTLGPKTDDWIVLDGARCEIVSWSEDPARAALFIQARRPS